MNSKIIVNKSKIHVTKDRDKNHGAAVTDKEDVIKKCKRQLFDMNTLFKLSIKQMEMLVAKIQLGLSEVVGTHQIQKHCDNKQTILF